MSISQEEAQKLEQDFYRRCGEILRIALQLEDTLEFFIMQYFIRPQGPRSFFFNDEVLARLNFSFKVELFNKICKELEIEKEKVKMINKNINNVKEMRNAVAHYAALINTWDEGFLIHMKRTKRTMFKENMKKITDELVKETENKKSIASQIIIGEIYRRLNEIESKVEKRQRPVV